MTHFECNLTNICPVGSGPGPILSVFDKSEGPKMCSGPVLGGLSTGQIGVYPQGKLVKYTQIGPPNLQGKFT